MDRVGRRTALREQRVLLWCTVMRCRGAAGKRRAERSILRPGGSQRRACNDERTKMSSGTNLDWQHSERLAPSGAAGIGSVAEQGVLEALGR